MDRQPVVAGQFYTGDSQTLRAEVRGFLDLAEGRTGNRTLLAMAPHAGYVFSGPVAGKTLGEARLASRVLLLGPNHTGMGQSLAMWDEGRWLTPGGGLDVDERLARELLESEPRLASDTAAHVQEHSLEVLVPFLEVLDSGTTIVPVAVSENRISELAVVASSIASVLDAQDAPVSIVVSSDMSHFVSDDEAKRLDAMALEPVLKLDPVGLYETVRGKGISMCGVLPMTLGLMIAKALGAESARLTGYSTSAQASGDYARVVGYAGVLVD